VEITTASPLFFDAYAQNQGTGSFVLVDPYSNVTVAAGMIRGEVRTADEVFGRAEQLPVQVASPGVVWEDWNISRAEREARQGHRAVVLWFTGLSGSGKSTIAQSLERQLFARGCRTMLLDGDQLRHGLCGDLGFDAADRRENIRRAGEVARLFFEQGCIVLCTFVSPYREDRERVRALLPEGCFLEVYVDADLETVKARDPKGLYARAMRGEIRNFTGIDAPYETPEQPEITAKTTDLGADEIVSRVIAELKRKRIL
jgi:bifunctional enzyme CysN/CysC